MFHKLLNSTLYFLLKVNTLQALFIICIFSFPFYLNVFIEAAASQRAIAAAQLGTAYLLLAFILYIFLIIIRQLNASSMRRRIVIFTRIFIRFHTAFAILGVIFVLYHIYFFFPFNSSLAHVFGILSFFALLPLLLTGYLRKQKASGARRRFHRYTAFIFLLLLTLHIFL